MSLVQSISTTVWQRTKWTIYLAIDTDVLILLMERTVHVKRFRLASAMRFIIITRTSFALEQQFSGHFFKPKSLFYFI